MSNVKPKITKRKWELDPRLNKLNIKLTLLTFHGFIFAEICKHILMPSFECEKYIKNNENNFTCLYT